jgi:hypothetical protein
MPDHRNSRNTGNNNTGWLFPHPLIWLAAAIVFFIETAWFALSDMRLADHYGARWELLAGGVCFLAGYAAWRHDARRLFLLFRTLALFILAGKELRVLNYLAMSAGAPFRDALFARVDAFLGFDWLACVKWVNSHGSARDALEIFYNSHKLLFMATLIFLVIKGHEARIREFLIIFFITALVTIIIGGLAPAAGGYAYFHPAREAIANLPATAGRYFLPHLVPLNAGQMKTIDLGNMAGLVAFPSYHVVMALMVIHAARGSRLQPFILFPALGMIAATPVFGGHYLVDILGGALLFALTAWGYARLAADRTANSIAAQASMDSAVS